MRLSANIGALELKLGLPLAAKIVKEAGFDACDYSLISNLELPNSPYLTDNYREVAANARRIIEAEGLTVNQTHAPFKFPYNMWADPELFNGTVFPRMVRALEISSILGADVCVIHPLHHLDYRGNEEKLFTMNMEYYGRLLPYAEKFGVKIGVENMWQKHKLRKNICIDTCATTAEFIRYVDGLNSEYAVACLDVGHVLLPDQPESVGDFIRALGRDRLLALHVHDNEYASDAHMLPYMGKLDWEEITKALGEIDYKGDLTYEVSDALFANAPEHMVGAFVNLWGAVGKDLLRRVEAHRPKK